jgi:hypothetical protein
MNVCVCVCLFCVCVVLCVGSGLATGWSLVQGGPTVCEKWLRKWKDAWAHGLEEPLKKRVYKGKEETSYYMEGKRERKKWDEGWRHEINYSPLNFRSYSLLSQD